MFDSQAGTGSGRLEVIVSRFNSIAAGCMQVIIFLAARFVTAHSVSSLSRACSSHDALPKLILA